MSTTHPHHNAITSLTQFFENNQNCLDKEKGFIYWFDHEMIPNDIFGIINDSDVKLMQLGNFYVVTEVINNSPWISPVQYCAERGLLFTITFNASNEDVRTNKWYFSGRTPDYLLDYSFMAIFSQADLYPSLHEYMRRNDIEYDPDCYENAVIKLSPISAAIIDSASFGIPLSCMPETHAIEDVHRKITPSDLNEGGRESISKELSEIIRKYRRSTSLGNL
ncbi:hypothetical protein [Teredinibacter turnerae]|uniref:hypothetical protein n=1 Tax=Teredinibacter turnerae TaxID=2426 RepID=UPI00048D9E5E|nr:hypothetical protein [Teredinibacter turnerae]